MNTPWLTRLVALACGSAAAVLAASCGGAGHARVTNVVAARTAAPLTTVVVSVPVLAAASDAVPERSPPPKEGYEIYPGVAVPEEWVDCRTDADCAIVEAGCCDHCNGGAITTVNRAFAEQARARLTQVGCEHPCAKIPCDRAADHTLVCMTRACHFEDLEPEVYERIWGGPRSDDSSAQGVERVIERGR